MDIRKTNNSKSNLDLSAQENMNKEMDLVIKEELVEEESVNEPDYFGNFEENFISVKKDLDELNDHEVIVKEEIDSDNGEDFSDYDRGNINCKRKKRWSKSSGDSSDESEDESNNRQCTGCILSFEKLIFELQKSDEKALEVFCAHGILPRVRTCPNCKNLCLFNPSERMFYCDQKVIEQENGEFTCTYSVSQDHDTWLFHFKHNPNLVLRFINLFLQKFYSFTYCAVNYELSEDTFEEWQRLCLEVCTYWLNNQEPIGGPGVEVEIGDSKFTPFRRADKKEADVWVFAGLERGSQKKFLVEVQTESREALIPLIQKYVKPQTIVFADTQEPYPNITELPQNYTHFRNDLSTKSKEEIDLDTKNIVSLLYSLKIRIIKSGFKSSRSLPRFLFLDTHQNYQTILHEFLVTVSAMYPPPQQV